MRGENFDCCYSREAWSDKKFPAVQMPNDPVQMDVSASNVNLDELKASCIKKLMGLIRNGTLLRAKEELKVLKAREDGAIWAKLMASKPCCAQIIDNLLCD